MSDTNVNFKVIWRDNIKVNKAIGPDKIPPWALRECSHLLAAPVTAIFKSSLREGVLPTLRKSATGIPLSKKHPPVTPLIDKVFECLVLIKNGSMFMFMSN